MVPKPLGVEVGEMAEVEEAEEGADSVVTTAAVEPVSCDGGVASDEL